MSMIRVCNPVGFGMFYDLHSDGRITGVYAPVIDDFISAARRANNASVTFRSENDGIGQLIDEKTATYDGCIGEVQKNQSDIVFQFTNYPLPVEPHNVYQGHVFTDSVIQFVGFYTLPHEEQAVQLESCFSSFDHLVWLLCILVAVVSWLTVVLRRSLVVRRLIRPTSEDVAQLRIPRRSILYQVMTHMASRGDLQLIQGVFGKVMYCTLSIFAFLVLFHFCSFIKTELVAVRPPKTLRSYDDLINSQVGIAAYKGMDTFRHFSGAKPGSKERQLWDLSETKYPNGENALSTDHSSFPWVFERLLKQQIVAVSESIWVPFFMRCVCSYTVNEKRIEMTNDWGWYLMEAKANFPLVGQGDKMKVLLKGFLLNQSTLYGVLRKFRKMLARHFESGLTLRTFVNIEKVDIFGMLTSLEDVKLSSRGLIEECVQNIMFTPYIALSGVKLVNMRNIFAIFSALLFIPLIVLLFEIISAPMMGEGNVNCRCGIKRRRMV